MKPSTRHLATVAVVIWSLSLWSPPILVRHAAATLPV